MLELHEGVMGARDVAGAAGTSPHSGGSLDHGADHFGMLPHAEIVVGAPDHDVARPLRGMPHRMWKPPRDTLKIGKTPVTPLIMEAVEGGTEELAVIHRENLKRSLKPGWRRLFRAFPGLKSSQKRAAVRLKRREPGCPRARSK